MKRIGEDVAEKLDYQPGVFTGGAPRPRQVGRAKCEKITQAPVALHVIDKGIPTTGLLAQVLVAKYLDHLPLYRQEAIFERAGMAIARSTWRSGWASAACNCSRWWTPWHRTAASQPVLHADETPVAMLKPGHGKTHRPTCGATARPASTRSRRSSSTSPTTAAGSNVREFLGCPARPQNPAGRARSSPTTSAATRPASSSG